MKLLVKRIKVSAVAACACLFTGCAMTSADTEGDPFEPMNRTVYGFNDGVDRVLVKPVAIVYKAVLPAPVQDGVRNVFANLNDVTIALNNLLQGKFGAAASDIGRIAINTTAGLLGVFDVATPVGLEKHNEDFGQTLGYWGMSQGPYLVLPLLGPSTFRDGAGLFVDMQLMTPEQAINPTRDRNAALGLKLVSKRADLLDASRLLDMAALDGYSFLRDAYLQRRMNLVHDGNPPRESIGGEGAR